MNNEGRLYSQAIHVLLAFTIRWFVPDYTEAYSPAPQNGGIGTIFPSCGVSLGDVLECKNKENKLKSDCFKVIPLILKISTNYL